MPHVGELPLLLVDRILQLAGVAVLALALYDITRPKRWKNPLAPTGFTGQGPGLLAIVAVIVAYFALGFAGVQIADIDAESAEVTGSHAWFALHTIDNGARLVACMLMIMALQAFPAFARDGNLPPGSTRWIAVPAGAALVILALAYTQLQAIEIAWRWTAPAVPHPSHVVLDALEANSWGTAGVVVLLVTALAVAPLVEELFFRGLILQALWRHLGHAWLAILLSGVLFGLIHMQQPQAVVPLATMGVILAYIRIRYRSLAACVITHSLFNAKTMLFVLLNPDLARAAY